jgi:hypothetical protein
MRKRFDLIIGLTAAAGLTVLILDSKTAIAGACDGIALCIRTLIPSLFPFLFLTALLSSSLKGQHLRVLRPLGRLCRIPDGAQYILLSGLIGGYPIGAISVSDAYRKGYLSRQDAGRMLAFCNNCGPAFMFGITAALFDEPWVPWVLMGIHMISAVFAGMIIPGEPLPSSPCKSERVSPVRAINQALRSMAAICGWVTLFKILLVFIERWVGWYFPTELQVLISGILELSNGCVELTRIESSQIRFILCAGFLSFGGLCVTMQTLSVIENVPKDLYFPGKVLQCCISISIASMLCGKPMGLMPAMIAIALSVFLRRKQKICRNLQIIDV